MHWVRPLDHCLQQEVDVGQHEKGVNLGREAFCSFANPVGLNAVGQQLSQQLKQKVLPLVEEIWAACHVHYERETGFK